MPGNHPSPSTRLIARHSLGLALCAAILGADSPGQTAEHHVALPAPEVVGEIPLETAIARRRSTRRFDQAPIELAAVAQLLWAAQGITDGRGFRTTPSAGALFPLEILLVAGSVSGLTSGVYAYDPKLHRLGAVSSGDVRHRLARAAYEQHWIADAPAALIITARHELTTRKYGARGIRYVQIEAGHVGQNVYLQAESLGLGTCMVGAFDDSAVKAIAHLPRAAEPIAIMPIGRPAPPSAVGE